MLHEAAKTFRAGCWATDDKKKEYNYDRSFQAIQSALGNDVEEWRINSILNAMEITGVKGAISAEISQGDFFHVVLSIESEDHHKYALHMEDNYSLVWIIDLETDKAIYGVE